MIGKYAQVRRKIFWWKTTIHHLQALLFLRLPLLSGVTFFKRKNASFSILFKVDVMSSL